MKRRRNTRCYSLAKIKSKGVGFMPLHVVLYEPEIPQKHR